LPAAGFALRTAAPLATSALGLTAWVMWLAAAVLPEADMP
jgi:hypothetical protein